MNKKLITQLILIFIIIGIIFFTFILYFYESNSDPKKITQINLENDTSMKEGQSNLIKDLIYNASDNNGNQYTIRSKLGEISLKNPDIIFMTDVTADIYAVDSDPVNITSKHAIYNSSNLQTNFYEDVLILYLDNKVEAEKMDLDFEKNIGTLTENIIYTSPSMKLFADRVEIDLITKDSQIFMIQEELQNKKVKVFGNNN
tara:strand:+ start:1171 stop:1773 length:603 start_codon:yes stop_codon:yes gene_type:complete